LREPLKPTTASEAIGTGMNPQERNVIGISPAAVASASRWNRRRTVITVVAGLLIVSAIVYAGLSYLYRCGNCGRSPILCDDPCTLPTFGQFSGKIFG
jgi:hypothetical protein